MSVDTLLSRLDRVKRSGEGRWTAICPGHDDKGPSLAIRETDDGRILLHCFAGCSVEEVLAAVGMSFDDLFPPRAIEHGKPERRPFPAADILRCIAFEALVVASAGASLLAGTFSGSDRERLILAVSRIQSAINAGGLAHE
ncbi:hypothetical protein FACS189475_04610 [Betaproteobacteria bacterium]|nr:hypothetical protein FACS189475_04610 [Betaproteobacteria bacterium]